MVCFVYCTRILALLSFKSMPSKKTENSGTQTEVCKERNRQTQTETDAGRVRQTDKDRQMQAKTDSAIARQAESCRQSYTERDTPDRQADRRKLKSCDQWKLDGGKV